MNKYEKTGEHTNKTVRCGQGEIIKMEKRIRNNGNQRIEKSIGNEWGNINNYEEVGKDKLEVMGLEEDIGK